MGGGRLGGFGEGMWRPGQFGRCESDGVGWMLDSTYMSFWTVLCVCAR